MFGSDPKLPLDHLLGMPSSDEDDQLDEYVASHQQRLRDAFRVAPRCSEDESLKRRTRNDKSANASDLPVGCRVFVRNVKIRGRSKMQDNWEEEPYRVLDRPNPEGNVYVVTLLNADGPMRTLHRDKLLDARELVPEMEADPSKESRITMTMGRSTALPNEQDDDDFEVGLLRIAPTVDQVGRDMATPFETTGEPQEHVIFSRIDYARKIIRPSRAHLGGPRDKLLDNIATQIDYHELPTYRSPEAWHWLWTTTWILRYSLPSLRRS